MNGTLTLREKTGKRRRWGTRTFSPFLHAPLSGRGRRLLERRNRATLAWALAAFVFLQGGLRVVIDFWVPELRDPVFETKARPLGLAVAGLPRASHTVLMMGSSVTESAFKARFLEDLLVETFQQPAAVFNMSRPGGGPLCQLVWTRRLLDRGIRPTLLLIEISPFLFAGAEKPVDVYLFPVSFLEQKDVPVIRKYAMDDALPRHWWEARLVPSYGHRLTMLSYLVQEMVPKVDRVTSGGTHDGRFWQASLPDPPELLQRKVDLRVKHLAPTISQFAMGATSIQALEELLGLLKKEKVPAALVLMPKTTELRRLYHSENLRQFVATIDRLGRHYDCSFIDAFDWLADDRFADGYHFNTEGADLFSRRLAREVLIPRLATPPP